MKNTLSPLVAALVCLTSSVSQAEAPARAQSARTVAKAVARLYRRSDAEKEKLHGKLLKKEAELKALSELAEDTPTRANRKAAGEAGDKVRQLSDQYRETSVVAGALHRANTSIDRYANARRAERHAIPGEVEALDEY